MMTKAWAWRLAAAVVAVLIPACSAENTPDVLFLDSFSGTYPGTAWNQPAPVGTASGVKDVLHDSGTVPPLSCLRMTASSSGSSVTSTTTMTFNAPSVSFSVKMAAKAAAADDGIGTVTIRDNVAAAVASASWDNTTGLLTLAIGVTNTSIAAPNADLAFHRLVFSVSGNGTATWTLDNASTLIQKPGFSPGPLTLELGASFPGGTSWASFYFDNVSVTTP